MTEQTIASKRIELELLAREHERFPEWETEASKDELADEFIEREEAEWRVADVILCGSEFVRDGIGRCGGPVQKCVVVPYGVDAPTRNSRLGTRKSSGPLRVLTVGVVGLRKGSPYVLEAAKQLKGKAVFRMVGSIGVTPEVEFHLRQYVQLTGAVPRNEIAAHFRWADVFLLPSLCEGSATVTYEAMAFGLPVICTPNTGSVVRDSIDGFIVPIRDSEQIADRLNRLATDPARLVEMGAQAEIRSCGFNLKNYANRMLPALLNY